MEPKLNRRKTEKAHRLLVISVVLCIVSVILCVALPKTAPACIAALVFTFYAALKHDEVTKCPHCGTSFRGVYLSAPNAGYCRKCGKLMEFDE